MGASTLRKAVGERYGLFAAVGGIGTGLFFALEGDHTLGRNESRPGRLLDVRDYCKMHIISHYFSVLTGARADGGSLTVLPIGKVGADEAGKRMRDEMAAAGMDTRFVTEEAGKPTMLSVCFQYEDGSGGNITTSDSAASALVPGDVDAAEAVMAGHKDGFIALAAPEVSLETRFRLLEVARRHGGLTAAAFASAEMKSAEAMGMLPLVDILAMNEDEAATLAGVEFSHEHESAFLETCAAKAARYNPGMRVILSAGAKGAWGLEDGAWSYSPAVEVRPASTAGAGDALLGGVLAGLAAGMPFASGGAQRKSLTDGPLSSALDFAVVLAGLTVTSPHTIHPEADLDAVIALAKSQGAEWSEDLRKIFG